MEIADAKVKESEKKVMTIYKEEKTALDKGLVEGSKEVQELKIELKKAQDALEKQKEIVENANKRLERGFEAYNKEALREGRSEEKTRLDEQEKNLDKHKRDQLERQKEVDAAAKKLDIA